MTVHGRTVKTINRKHNQLNIFIWKRRNLFPPFSDTPKPIGNIFHLIPVYPIEMLIGIRRFQATQFFNIRSQLYIFKVLNGKTFRQFILPRIPPTFTKAIDCRWRNPANLSTSKGSASPPIKQTQVTAFPYFCKRCPRLSSVKDSPTFSNKWGLWQPLHLLGQLERLIARVTSSGISWNTMS